MAQELADMIARLRVKAASKRDAAKAVADAEYRADMESIARLASLDGDEVGEKKMHAVDHVALAPETHAHTSVAKSASPKERRFARKDGPTTAVRRAIQIATDGFSVDSLAKAMSDMDGGKPVARAPIYSALNKLAGAGEIEKLPPVDGANFSTYRVVKLKVMV